MKRLLVISSAKLSLFKISRELQFGVCNHGEPHSRSLRAREGGFYREEKEIQRAIVNRSSRLFMGSVFARKGVFLLPMMAGLKSSSFRSPKSI